MTIQTLAKRLVPASWLWRVRVRRWNVGFPDPELRILPRFCRETCVDVGASLGLYTMHMLAYATQVWAFEPRRAQAAELRARLRDDPRLHVEAVALSDHNGTADFRICTSDPGRSTLEGANALQGLTTDVTTVLVRTLDSYAFERVSCVKIDVEGHEEAVLRGAERTLDRDRPALFIELEERHNPGITARAPRWLSQFGYEQFFVLAGRLLRAEDCPNPPETSNSIFLCQHHR